MTNSGQVFLENAFPSAIQFSNLLFYRPSTLDAASLAALSANPSPPGGMSGFLSSGIVPAEIGSTPGELAVGQFSLSPGDFLTARSDNSFVDSGFSTLTVTDAYGHEHQSITPELSSLILLSLGNIGLLGYVRRGGYSSGPRSGAND